MAIPFQSLCGLLEKKKIDTDGSIEIHDQWELGDELPYAICIMTYYDLQRLSKVSMDMNHHPDCFATQRMEIGDLVYRLFS